MVKVLVELEDPSTETMDHDKGDLFRRAGVFRFHDQGSYVCVGTDGDIVVCVFRLKTCMGALILA